MTNDDGVWKESISKYGVFTTQVIWEKIPKIRQLKYFIEIAPPTAIFVINTIYMSMAVKLTKLSIDQ